MAFISRQSTFAAREAAGDLLILDHDDHPDADLVVGAQKGRAGDVARFASSAPAKIPACVVVTTRGARIATTILITVRPALGKPHDFCSHGIALLKSVRQPLAHMRGPADAREKGALQQPWDAEGGGDEDDAEGWGGADEEVVLVDSR